MNIYLPGYAMYKFADMMS